MSTAKAPAFQFYPGDWLASGNIILMTPEQEGGYIRLLCYDWSGDGIVDNDAVLAALSRLGEGWLNGGSEIIRKCFVPHPEKPGFITNPRIQKEREKQRNWKEKSREGGLKSAASRGKGKGKGGSTKPKPKANRPVEPKGNSSSSSSSSDNTPIVPTEKSPDPDPPPADEWDEDKEVCRIIWEGHPQMARTRSSKAKVWKAWQQVPKQERLDYDGILESLTLWRTSMDWVKDDGTFVAGCHLWIKDRKWTVIPVPAKKTGPHESIGGDVSANEIGRI